jgi:hypothetical protein
MEMTVLRCRTPMGCFFLRKCMSEGPLLLLTCACMLVHIGFDTSAPQLVASRAAESRSLSPPTHFIPSSSDGTLARMPCCLLTNCLHHH